MDIEITDNENAPATVESVAELEIAQAKIAADTLALEAQAAAAKTVRESDEKVTKIEEDTKWLRLEITQLKNELEQINQNLESWKTEVRAEILALLLEEAKESQSSSLPSPSREPETMREEILEATTSPSGEAAGPAAEKPPRKKAYRLI